MGFKFAFNLIDALVLATAINRQYRNKEKCVVWVVPINHTVQSTNQEACHSLPRAACYSGEYFPEREDIAFPLL